MTAIGFLIPDDVVSTGNCREEASRLKREVESGDATTGVLAIFQREGTAVVLGNLPAKHQSYPGPFWLGGEKRHEQIHGLGNAGPVILYGDLGRGTLFPPAHAHAGIAVPGGSLLENRLDGVLYEIDQHLFDLSGVA